MAYVLGTHFDAVFRRFIEKVVKNTFLIGWHERNDASIYVYIIHIFYRISARIKALLMNMFDSKERFLLRIFRYPVKPYWVQI